MTAVVLAAFRLLCVAVVVAACAAGGVRAPAGPRTIRVLVFNMHAGKDAGGVDNLERVAGVVQQTGADVVLLQEVDRMTQRSGRTDQPAALAARTGFHVAFGSTLDYDGGKYGIALLARWPIVRDTLVPLRITPPQPRAGGSLEPRGALRAVIDSPHGTITIFNTHLDASRDDRWRRQEAAVVQELVAAAQAAGAHHVLAGGDFNSTPESEVQVGVRQAGLRDAWFECGHGDGFTYPADSAVKRIDYLFFVGGARCTAAEVISSRASDHRPLLVTVVLTPES